MLLFYREKAENFASSERTRDWEENNGRGKTHAEKHQDRLNGKRECTSCSLSLVYFWTASMRFDSESCSRQTSFGRMFEVPKLDQFTNTSISTNLQLGATFDSTKNRETLRACVSVYYLLNAPTNVVVNGKPNYSIHRKPVAFKCENHLWNHSGTFCRHIQFANINEWTQRKP